jgi:hypothetical protein
LQSDETIEIIILISTTPATGAAEWVLAQLHSSDTPTVVCFVGSHPQLIWRAGGIPAAHLDEAAWRAAAWVRGWDQALITSRLEERDEQLASQARSLRARLGPSRTGMHASFASRILCQEAQQVVSGVSKAAAQHIMLEVDPERRIDDLRRLRGDPQLACVLLDLAAGPAQNHDMSSRVPALLQRWPTPPLAIAYLHGWPADGTLQQMRQRLTAAGVICTRTSAAAARLAALVTSPPE